MLCSVMRPPTLGVSKGLCQGGWPFRDLGSARREREYPLSVSSRPFLPLDTTAVLPTHRVCRAGGEKQRNIMFPFHRSTGLLSWPSLDILLAL